MLRQQLQHVQRVQRVQHYQDATALSNCMENFKMFKADRVKEWLNCIRTSAENRLNGLIVL